MAQSSELTNQVRWLVVGPVSPIPTGRTFTLQRADFMEWLADQKMTCEVTVPDTLGSGESRAFTLEVEKPRSLTLKTVTAKVPEFVKLLGAAGKVRDPQQAIEDVKAIVGAGPLTDKIAELGGLTPPPPEPAADGKADDSVDALTAADMPESKSQAATAVDAFVKSTATSKPVRASKSARKIRDAIEEAVYAAARAVLEAPEAHRLESSVRGLRFLVNQCLSTTGLRVDVMDVPGEQILSVLKERKIDDLVDEPDAVFIPYPLDDVNMLQELAELAEEQMFPVVVDVAPALFGKDDFEAMFDHLEEVEPKNVDPAWMALRQEESSRWLCAVANGVVLQAEGSGVAARSTVGSGVWALGAMLSKSYAATGSFARITGRPGSISAPGVRTLTSGRHEGTAAPTETFIPIRGQAAMAKHGFTALGSSRNSDTVVLAQTPMVRASSDAVPLPAQLLTGRIVRFANWVRDQLPSQADSETVSAVFKEAADVFLFPGMQEVGNVAGALHEEDGNRELRVHAQVHPAHAGIPFEIAFALPFD